MHMEVLDVLTTEAHEIEGLCRRGYNVALDSGFRAEAPYWSAGGRRAMGGYSGSVIHVVHICIYVLLSKTSVYAGMWFDGEGKRVQPVYCFQYQNIDVVFLPH